jgi:hypothetical protein
VVTYTGTGSTLTPTSSLGFNPDLVWIKSRSAATDHTLYDSVRGAQARLESNNTDVEVTSDNGLTAFNSNGFTLGTLGQVNTNAATYVGWTWDAGSSTVTNTQGSITSSVRANASAGFSIVTYTGGGVDGSVGHGLGVAPVIYFVKNRSASSNWAVAYTIVDGSLDVRYLNLTNAAGNASQSVPTSTVINLQQSAGETTSGNNYVIYCFAPVAGYSSFGSYTGNGSADGPFVYTNGMRPRWLMIKCSSAGSTSWQIVDAARPGYNVIDLRLRADTSESESSLTNSFNNVDFLSNGFKIRGSAGSDTNTNGATYIYAAFAESPFAANNRAR